MRIRSIFILASIALIIASCKQNQSNSNSNSKQENNDKLTIGVMASMDYLPLAVAQQRDYFADNNLEVIIQKFYSANDRDAALQSNNLDGTIIDYTGAAIQAAGGIPLQFTSQCDGTFELIVAKDSKINSIDDLKEKKIAISRNTVIDFCTDLTMSLAGLTTSDAEMIEINKIPLRLEMLNNNKIDATMLPDPFATIAKSEGNRGLISMNALNTKVTGIVFHKRVIDEKREALKKLYIAYNQAIKDLQTEPITNFEDLLIKEIGFPPALVASVSFPEYSEAQLPNEEDLVAVELWLKDKDIISEEFDIYSTIATDIFD